MSFPQSTLKQRKLFYQKAFSPLKLSSFFKITPQYYALDAGTETGIIKNRQDTNTIINLGPNLPPSKLRHLFLHYLPEDVYYDRNIYKNAAVCEKLLSKGSSPDKIKTNILAQQLAFDLDVENLGCNKCKANKRALKFCIPCLHELKKHTLRMYKQLKALHFKELKIVYTGRGYHLHVFDQQAYLLTKQQRTRLNNKLKDFPIDPWVSEGEVRLIRLPYTLNALVSRIVQPLTISQLKTFNPETKAVPRFLRK